MEGRPKYIKKGIKDRMQWEWDTLRSMQKKEREHKEWMEFAWLQEYEKGHWRSLMIYREWMNEWG